MSPQVLIAGAGPTGLTLAIDLARRGVTVRIVDQAEEFFAGSRGDGIQPRTLEIFEDLSVLDAVHAAGSPQAPMRVFLDGEFVTEQRMSDLRESTPDVPYANPWVLGQSDTEAILRSRLAEFGVEVELSTALVTFTQDAEGVAAVLAGPGGPETMRADYLVGADGGRSTVRKTLAIVFEGSTDESIRMLLGDVPADALDHEFGYWFAAAREPGAGIALTPLPGRRLFQFAAPLAQDAEPTRAVLQDQFDRLSGRADVALGEPVWSTVWRPNIRLAQRFRDGRVFLAGDAAHAHPPTGGQGMNTGIADAYNLGWKLAAALAGTPEALDTYEPERRAVAARVLGLSSDLLDKHVSGEPDALHRGEETHQLSVTYRAPGASGALVAGDRAPDAPLRRSDGTSIRLFQLLAGPCFTLLHFQPARTSTTPADDITVRTAPADLTGAADDLPTTLTAGSTIREFSLTTPDTDPRGDQLLAVDNHAFTAYDAVPGTRILIRPDGYLAWRSDR
ncbi:FAD-dependent monooxygenase [Nocardia sp. NEAU-G5]|uniref:FAD-dependent monooxygenase n=1 Tax=Nocardia albiluteola TaxID=2842303 RepID=A0ABS6BCA6_9NOCA|nr:FAD-dependent monooxygenase [Nocardia albiluteola]MBU3067927.1 FAD-dependent monooxygenase [Nocardia albiluteola]